MAFIDTKNAFQCKYQIRHLIIANGDRQISCNPSQILAIEHINDYENNMFAVLKCTLNLDLTQKMYIIANKTTIMCKLVIEKIGYDLETETNKTGFEYLINQVFEVHFNDEDDTSNPELMETRKNMNNTGSVTEENSMNRIDYNESQNLFEIYLFNPILLASSRYVINNIYEEANLQDIIGQMLSQSGHKNVLMGRIDNPELYQELLIPALPVSKALMYLDQYYGLYKTGGLVYYDIDRLYILSTNGRATAVAPGEWYETTILVPAPDNALPGSGMVRVPGQKIYYPTINEDEINVQKMTPMKNVSSGHDSKVVIKDGVVISDSKQNLTKPIDSANNTKVVYVNKTNKYTQSVIDARSIENETVIYISSNNLDSDAFKPNKTYRVIFYSEEKRQKYSGLYRLSYFYNVMRVTSENYLDSSMHIVLKKVSDEI